MADFLVRRSDGFMYIDMDPDAELDLTWNWTKWLAKKSGVGTIATATVTVGAELTAVGSVALSGAFVTQVVKLGTGVIGGVYPAMCRIVTSDAVPVKDERTIMVTIKTR
jgi:hypothetical protein